MISIGKKATALILATAFLISGFALVGEGETDAETISADTGWYSEGPSEFTISTAEQLAGLATLVNAGNDFSGKAVLLVSDIKLNGEWTPIGNGELNGKVPSDPQFKGFFTGNGHTISGLTINSQSEKGGLGLFGVVGEGGTVSELVLTDVHIRANDNRNAGAVVGVLKAGTVSDCVVGSQTDDSSIVNNKGCGGIVGKMVVEGTISNCDNYAKVENISYNSGGIVGAAYYTETGCRMYITNCNNYGVIAGATSVGGIVGLSCAEVSGCRNYSDISASEASIGGVVGEQKCYGSIHGCINYGDVSVSGIPSFFGAGGIVGWIRYVGEKTDYLAIERISVRNCVNFGNVVTTTNDAGGIVGTTYCWALVQDNINVAERLSATEFSAGIIGNYQIKEQGLTPNENRNDLSLSGNVSTTTSITANCTDPYIYDNGNVVNGRNTSTNTVDSSALPPVPGKIDTATDIVEVETTGDTAIIKVEGSGSVEFTEMKADLGYGSIIVKDGSCPSGVLVLSMKETRTPVISDATVTYDVDLGGITSQEIYLTMNVNIPSGYTPIVYSVKDGNIVGERIFSYSSESITILTDHNTPFSIVLIEPPVIDTPVEEEEDYPFYPWNGNNQGTATTPTKDTTSDDKKVLVAAAAIVVVMLAAVALMVNRNH